MRSEAHLITAMKFVYAIPIVLSVLSLHAQADVSSTIQISVSIGDNSVVDNSFEIGTSALESCVLGTAAQHLPSTCGNLLASAAVTNPADSAFEYESVVSNTGRHMILISPI